MSEEEEVSRVSMMWPVSLKEAVREKVGARGLTNFAIEAARAKLEGHGAAQAGSKELVEVKFLAQQLADAIATTGDYSDPLAVLQEIGLPSWVETTGWSDELAALVPREIPEGYRPLGVVHDAPDVAEPVRPASSAELADHVFEPSFTGRVCEKMVMRGGGGDQCGLPPEAHAPVVPPIEEAEDDELHRPMAFTGQPKGGKSPSVPKLSDEEAAAFGKLGLEPEGPAVGDPGTVRPAEEKGDLFARIQAAAADKGVDMSAA